MEDLPDGRIHIKMPFVESEMGYSVLLGMGHQCQVISPAHIRTEVIQRIALMKAAYE